MLRIGRTLGSWYILRVSDLGIVGWGATILPSSAMWYSRYHKSPTVWTVSSHANNKHDLILGGHTLSLQVLGSACGVFLGSIIFPKVEATLYNWLVVERPYEKYACQQSNPCVILGKIKHVQTTSQLKNSTPSESHHHVHGAFHQVMASNSRKHRPTAWRCVFIVWIFEDIIGIRWY